MLAASAAAYQRTSCHSHTELLMRRHLRNLAYLFVALFSLVSLVCLNTFVSLTEKLEPEVLPLIFNSQSEQSIAGSSQLEQPTVELGDFDYRFLKRISPFRARRHINSQLQMSLQQQDKLEESLRKFQPIRKSGLNLFPLKSSNQNQRTKSADDSSSDVFISVKTTARYHATRLRTILDTWFQLAKNQIYFFTDEGDESLSAETGGHLINTRCSSSHHRRALCCKLGVEYDFFLSTDKSWFCHFDDDNYVNVPKLFELLRKYDSGKDWYVGRPSTRDPIQITDPDKAKKTVSFWFATGGAGFCLSRALAEKMSRHISNGNFVTLGEKIRLPDDVTMGYVIEYLQGVRLTVIPQFHSHLESMNMIDINNLAQQISLSAGSYSSHENNVVAIDGEFTELEDPTRFKAIHCQLFPRSKICQHQQFNSYSEDATKIQDNFFRKLLRNRKSRTR